MKKLIQYIKRFADNQHCLFFLFWIGFSIPNFFLAFTEPITVYTKICSIVFAMSFFLLMMTLAKRPGKMFWWLFVFVFFNAFQLVLLDLFGEAVVAVDMFLNAVTTNPTEATELLTNLFPVVPIVVVFYVTLMVLAVVSVRNKHTLELKFIHTTRRIARRGFAVSILMILVNYYINPTFQFWLDIYPANVSYNFALSFERYFRIKNYHNTSADYTFDAHSTHPTDSAETYVFLIGETSRAANYGIYGYNRPTTPHLQQMKDELCIFRDALTQSNTTHKSVPMLLSAACAEDFDQIYGKKSMISAFKEVGFKTSFLSNQLPNGSFIDFFGQEADTCVFVKNNAQPGENLSDDLLLDLLKKRLADKSKKKFIVLHLYGSHFNYLERYPAKDAYFKPDDATKADVTNRQNLVNAFDNSIRYTDNFIYKVIQLVQAQHTKSTVIFTSDHGEDIYDDDRKRFLHASPSPTFYQVYVPYIIWMSPEYTAAYPQKKAHAQRNLNKPLATSIVTYHTMLSIAGINTKDFNIHNSLVDSVFVSNPRNYLTDHNQPTPMNVVIRHRYDIEQFKQRGLRLP